MAKAFAATRTDRKDSIKGPSQPAEPPEAASSKSGEAEPKSDMSVVQASSGDSAHDAGRPHLAKPTSSQPLGPIISESLANSSSSSAQNKEASKKEKKNDRKSKSKNKSKPDKKADKKAAQSKLTSSFLLKDPSTQRQDTSLSSSQSSSKKVLPSEPANKNDKFTKSKQLVDELKIFQNHNLINQQDPLRYLQLQLYELNKDDNLSRDATKKDTGNDARPSAAHKTANPDSQAMADSLTTFFDNSENFSTVKKGVLWELRNYDKLPSKIFSRWKKRYFVLTTDYFVCFKRSIPKVGQSEMGRFLYKTSLSDVTKVGWLKPKRNTKGPIYLHIRGRFNIAIWSRDSLDEWMFLINETITRLNFRRSNQTGQLTQQNTDPIEHQNAQAKEGSPLIAHETNKSYRENGSTDELQSHQSETSPENNPLDEPEKSQGQLDRHEDNSKSGSSKECELNDGQVILKPLPTTPSSESSDREDLAECENGPQANSKCKSELESEPSHTPSRGPITVSSDDPDTGHGLSVMIERPKSCRKPLAVPRIGKRKSSDTSTDSSNDRKIVSRSANLNETDLVNSANRPEPGEGNSDDVVESNHKTAIKKTAINNEIQATECDNTIKSEPKDINPATRESNKANKAPINLIRRDDSWQSLVSLTRIGKIPAVGNQEAKRSLYAQHIMPDKATGEMQSNRAHKIDIESAVTPSRAPLTRNQNQRSLLGPYKRPELRQAFAAIREPAWSVDIASPANLAPSAMALEDPKSLSCRRKLEQLQMLHNSNSVDYVRNYNLGNGAREGRTNDGWADIYSGPNHYDYGYSSMRSNLKSATSEFAFIRPTSGLMMSASQSTLPHQNHNNRVSLENQSTNRYQQPIRSSLVLTARHQPALREQHSDTNNNSLVGVAPVPSMGAGLMGHPPMFPHIGQLHGQAPLLNEKASKMNQQQQMPSLNCVNSNGNPALAHDLPMMSPLMRELPMKPNKKRNPVKGGSAIPKSSSLTSSIASFFRRAFSGRSKRATKKRPNELSDVCSSSLSAFEDRFSSNGMEVSRSAFSTGGKSSDGRREINGQKGGALGQSPRMIDMIEAFNSRTQAAAIAANLPALAVSTPKLERGANMNRAPASLANSGRLPSSNSGNQIREPFNQFGSPLHKSNSMSTTMGFGQAAEFHDQHKIHNPLYDNEAYIQLEEQRSALGAGACDVSPMVARSTKVMSANLTPVMLHRGSLMTDEHRASQQFAGQRQVSSRPDLIPRPSSIYGQPSMISPRSVIHNEENLNQLHNQFGLHRASLHGQIRERGSLNSSNMAGGLEFRRQPNFMKVSQLDTTREVAEELSSPIIESRALDQHFGLEPSPGNHQRQVSSRPSKVSKNIMSGSPSHDRFPKSKRQAAIVNPIPQSPTTCTIYDNHPMLQRQTTEQPQPSHYDNHILNPSANFHLDSSDATPRPNQSSSFLIDSGHSDPSSPLIIHDQDPYTIRPLNNNVSLTPARHNRVKHLGGGIGSESNRGQLNYKKPSELVAPMRPIANSDESNMNGPPNDAHEPTMMTQSQNHPAQSRSPLIQEHQSSNMKFQQSPTTRKIPNPGDMRSGSAFGSPGDRTQTRNYRSVIPVVNIAGAPGVNLEPSLAASLLKGTHIDAYANPSFTDNSLGEARPNSKTFLVSDRLSRSMANRQLANHVEKKNSSTPSRRDESRNVSSGGSSERFSIQIDELSSSSSKIFSSTSDESPVNRAISSNQASD